MKQVALLLIIFLGSFSSLFGQAKEITQNEFWSQFRQANQKPFETSKRVTSKEEHYKDGVLNSTTEVIDELLNPDRRRYVEIYKSDKINRREEMIKIGETYFCRENNGEWTKADEWCAGMSIGALPKAISSKFTSEETTINNQKAILYEQYLTYKNEYSPNKDKEGLSYFHDRFWVSSDGFILRREMEYGLLEPKKLYSKEVLIYEYNLKNLTIEEPVLDKKAKTQ